MVNGGARERRRNIARAPSKILILVVAIMARGSILRNLEKVSQGAGPELGDRQVPTSSSVWG